MTTLTFEDCLPSGVYALVCVLEKNPVREIAGLGLCATEQRSLRDVLIHAALHPEEHPDLNPAEFDRECALAAESIRVSGGIREEEREAP